MEEKLDIIERLNERLPKMSKSHKVIAHFIQNDYDKAVFMTAAKIGKRLKISESTVVRFATSLGYEGYPELQKALEELIKNELNSVQKMGLKYGNSTKSEIVTSVIQSDISKMQHTIENLDTDAFEMAVEIISNAKDVYIIGLRSCEPLANFLQFYLHMIRGNVHLINTSNATEIFEQMIRIGENDALIGISFPRYSMRTLKAMEFANDRSAKVISITDTVHSPMNMYSSCNLWAKSEMVSIVDSLVAPLSLINALVVALCLANQEQVNRNLKVLESVWDNYQLYMNDEINIMDEQPMLNYVLTKEKE